MPRAIVTLRQAPSLGVLEREEDALPALLAAQFGDLALDPDAGQAGEEVGDAAVERGDGVDLPLPVLAGSTLHASQDAAPLEQDLLRDVGRAAQ